MTNANIREAHRIITNAGSVMTRDQIDLLRSVLPPLPKQKTLEEITEHVYDAWVGTNGNEWPDDVHGGLETWLDELHTQLQGLKDTPATVPALPAGMRLAEHGVFGRVVVSPEVDMDDCYEIYHLAPGMSSGTDLSGVGPNSLTFIDSEPAAPAEPAHPEFLETEADYENAPVGTVAIREGGYPWTRIFGSWVAYSRNGYSHSEMAALRGKARILRWGYGE